MQVARRREQLRGREWFAINGAPLLLWLPALLVSLAVTLPIAYLFIRAYEGGEDVWHLIWRARTLDLLRNTALLALIVTAASVVIALPYAWLVQRTDLPWRRFWGITG